MSRFSIFALRALLIVVLIMIAAHLGQAQDPVKVSAGAYKLVSENNRVRILEVTLKPGDSIPVHSHPDHVAIAIVDCKIAITKGGKAQEADLKAGQTLWIPAESHSAKNIGTSMVRLVVVELKEAAKK